MAEVLLSELEVSGKPARVFVGGEGTPLLLVHGGWGGAAAHWSTVWNDLAQRFRIIAPDLPGVGDTTQPGLGSIGAYAGWLSALCDALSVERAWCVGNSFGASVVERFAADFPERCEGVVFVNGFGLPRTPLVLRWLGRTRTGGRILRALHKLVAYTPRALARAFVDESKIPDEIRAVISQRRPPQVRALAEVMIAGGYAERAPISPILVWGRDDHLPGTNLRSAQKLAASLPGSDLRLVPNAGHFPQVENATVFVRTLVEAIAAARSGLRQRPFDDATTSVT